MESKLTHFAIIGGTGFESMSGFTEDARQKCETPYGELSSDLVFGEMEEVPIVFLPRHGEDHHIAPHKINYRANLFALKQAGVTSILGIAAVGGIHRDAIPATIVIPDQIIDYTWGREHTFYDGGAEVLNNFGSPLDHIDFSRPYDSQLIKLAKQAAVQENIDFLSPATYGVTQGPRLESSAEIQRLERDGCDIVGMTAMPEAALARELQIPYVTIAMVVNAAAGKTEENITMDIIRSNLAVARANVIQLLKPLLKKYSEKS